MGYIGSWPSRGWPVRGWPARSWPVFGIPPRVFRSERRTPVALVIITADYCENVFGVAPCTATGEECFNTFPSCKDKTNYVKGTKDYRFVSPVAPIPLELVRPYVSSIKLLPTEISTTLTVSGRVSIEMADEADTDVGVDPYVTNRSAFPAIPGTFWRKWIARNRNFRARTVRIYEGWLGDREDEFVEKWIGSIENITVSGNSVKIEAADILAGLSAIEIPAKVDVKLLDAITGTQTAITASNLGEGLEDAPNYIKIGEEVIGYSEIDFSTGVLSGLTRGAFGTIAAEAAAKTKVGKVRYYPPANPFDTLKEMLVADAGISSANVDSTGIDLARDHPGGDLTVWAIIDEPTKLNQLYFELIDLLDCKSWVNEDLKITVRRNLPHDPTRTITEFSDDANIIHQSAKVDGNEKSRLTRFYLYWDRPGIGKNDDPALYGRMDLAVDATAESSNEYGDVIEKKLYCRWLHSDGFVEEVITQYARNLAMRQVWRNRDASPIVTLGAEMKDASIRTGDYIALSTDEIVDIYGNPMAGASFQVIKRDVKGANLVLSMIRIGVHKTGYIHATSTPNGWSSATGTEKKYGYISQAAGSMPDGADGYYIF